MRTKTNRGNDRDNLLVKFLQQHRGRRICVSSKVICEFMKNNGYEMKPTTLFPHVHRLMYERNLPICYIAMKGYYIAENSEDITPVIADLKKRINGHQKHIDFLLQFTTECY